MALNKVEICGVNTARLPILTNEEKDALLSRSGRATRGTGTVYQGKSAARFERHPTLFLCRRKRRDLFQIGCIGLIKAIDHFNTELGVRFSTYAVPMIIGEIRRFLRDNNALRVSRSLRDTAYRAMQSREALEKQLGREPTMDEIAQSAGLTRREVTAAAGIGGGADQSGRAGVHRWRRCDVCDRSGAGPDARTAGSAGWSSGRPWPG